MYNAFIFLLAMISLAQFFLIRKLRKDILKISSFKQLTWNDILKQIQKEINH